MEHKSWCCNAEIIYKQTCSRCNQPTITKKGIYEMFDEIDKINSVEDVELETQKKDRELEQADLSVDSNWWHNQDNQFTVCFDLICREILTKPMDVYDFFLRPWKYTEYINERNANLLR